MSTNCVFPPELDDKQLLAYLDDHEANPETARHLEKCSYCREKASALDRLQKRMTTRLYRITCPPPIELGEFHLQMLPASQRLVIGQHLRECPHCTQEIDQLKEFLSDLAPGMEGNLLQQTKLLIARLVNWHDRDSAIGEISPALRGKGEGPVTFEANGVVIVLDIQPANEGKVNILGQVVADEQERWTGAMVKIQQTGGSQTTAILNDLGAFRCEEAFSGSIRITITSQHGVEVQIPNIGIDV